MNLVWPLDQNSTNEAGEVKLNRVYYCNLFLELWNICGPIHKSLVFPLWGVRIYIFKEVVF